MTCRELVEMLIDYTEGDLPEEIRVQVEQHVKRCPPCGHFFTSYHITIKITRKLPPAPMPTSLTEKLKAMLKE